jgi:N-acetylneuraminic acid mutarotase
MRVLLLITAITGNLRDLYSLDPSSNTSMRWTNLTTDGITARNGHGFASADEKLYVFGGTSAVVMVRKLL